MLIACAEEARVEHPEPQDFGAVLVVFPGYLVSTLWRTRPARGAGPAMRSQQVSRRGRQLPRIRQNQGTVGTMPEPSLGHSAGERTDRDAMGREVTRGC